MTRPFASLDDILARRHLPALDGLRAVAVAFVVLSHAGLRAVPADLGVTLFFVLSGFLITWLLIAEQERTGSVSLRAFYWRRTLRIFPAYYALIAGTFVLHRLMGRDWTPAQIGTALGYLVDVYIPAVGDLSHPVNHAWSLAIEEQFYLLWPMLFLAAAARGRTALAWTTAGALVAGLLTRTVGVTALGWGWFTVEYSLWTRFDSLMAGCLLAVLLSMPRTRQLAERLGAHPVWALGTVALLVASRMIAPLGYHHTVRYTIESLLLAVLIVQLLMVSRSALWRWLDWKPIAFIGTLSYSIYLWHSIGLAIGERLPLPSAIKFAAGIATALVMAFGSYLVIEKPFLALKARYQGRPPQEPPQRDDIAA